MTRGATMVRLVLGQLAILTAIAIDRLGGSIIALRVLEAVSRRLPTLRHEIASEVAYLHERSGRLSRAIQALEEVGSPSTDSCLYFTELGHLYEKINDFPKAAENFEKALAMSADASPEFVQFIRCRLAAIRTSLE